MLETGTVVGLRTVAKPRARPVAHAWLRKRSRDSNRANPLVRPAADARKPEL